MNMEKATVELIEKLKKLADDEEARRYIEKEYKIHIYGGVMF